MNTQQITALALAAMISGCAISHEPEITGDWKSDLKQGPLVSTYTFKDNGRFYQTVDGDNNYIATGEWRLSENRDVEVTFTGKNKFAEKISIEFISKDKIACKWGEASFVMYRAKE